MNSNSSDKSHDNSAMDYYFPPSTRIDEGFKDIALASLLSLGVIGAGALNNLFAKSSVKPTAELVKKIPVKVYVVKSGDTLSGIADKSNVSLNAILKANSQIKDPNTIKIGDNIIIPIDEKGKIANIKSVEDKPTKSVSSESGQSAISDSNFIDYMKFVENGIRSGYDKNKKLWFPHKSVEGGLDTIAYGHKLKKGENFSSGITERDAIKLLLSDLRTAESVSKRDIKSIYTSAKKDGKLKSSARFDYDQLSVKEKQMCLDFAYNLGSLRKFPTFFTALLNKDIDTMKREYKRYFDKTPLVQRNDKFFDMFLKSYESSS